ncbi:MAG: peptidase C1, partial [Chlorobiales bacterium]|nr:peptidase C1 [Chlorobiales bacterium]
MELKTKKNQPSVTSSGHALGYIPPPVQLQTQVADKKKADVKPMGLPSSYDLRTLSTVSSVKDQGGCGACWAFATMGSLESK